MPTPVRPRALTGVAIVVGALTAGAATPALAATKRPSSVGSQASTTVAQQRLATIQSVADAAIDRRLSSLSEWTQGVQGASHLSTADRSTLLTTLSTATAGLTSLRTTIAGATDPVTALVEYRTIFTSYRIYALVDRQVAFTRGADAELAVAQSFSAAIGKAQNVLAGAGTPAEQASLEDLKNQVTTVTDDASGVATAILSLTPAAVPNPADPPSAITTARTDLLSGRHAVTAAMTDLQALRSDLHAG